jgi:methionyl-tRNA formyltransferase
MTRIALLTLESALNAEAVAGFLRAHGEGVALVGLSDPFRPGAGGPLRQAWRHLRRSGVRLLPFLWVNYALPGWLATLRRRPGRIAETAAAQGIPVRRLRDVNGPEFAAALREAGATLLVTFHFDQILSAETLALVPEGGLNIHPSLLPRHRGPVPTIWALAEAEPAWGVTLHRLVPRIDAGPILAQRAVPLPAGTTASAAARALHAEGAGLLAEALARPPVPRQTPPLPYCPFPPPALLRDLAARGRRLVDRADLRHSLRLRIGHGSDITFP